MIMSNVNCPYCFKPFQVEHSRRDEDETEISNLREVINEAWSAARARELNQPMKDATVPRTGYTAIREILDRGREEVTK